MALRIPLTLSATEGKICELLRDAREPSPLGSKEALIAAASDEQLWSVAVANELDPIIAHRLIDLLGAANVPDQWLDAHRKVQTGIARRLEYFDCLADEFAQAGITVVLLKNGGIARGIHSCFGCCPMGDLDVLVNRRDFLAAHEIALKNGLQFEFQNPHETKTLDHAISHGGAEYKKRISEDNILLLELQWRPVAGRWIEPSQEPSTTDLLDRSITILGTKARLLAPEDNLLQVALHTAKHSYVRAPGFRLHLDVDRIVRAYPSLSWDTFLAQVESSHVRTAVYFSLAIPNSLLSTPIPKWVLDRLRPAKWKEDIIVTWLNRVGLFWSVGSKFSLASYFLFTSLLYDDLGTVVRQVVPNKSVMIARHQDQRTKPIWGLYAQHWADLFLRRRTI